MVEAEKVGRVGAGAGGELDHESRRVMDIIFHFNGYILICTCGN